jgi:replicative DNA helicase
LFDVAVAESELVEGEGKLLDGLVAVDVVGVVVSTFPEAIVVELSEFKRPLFKLAAELEVLWITFTQYAYQMSSF